MIADLYFSLKSVCSALIRALSWTSAVFVILGVVCLLSFYIYTGFQPYRGPTKIYFFLLLGVALISPRVAVLLFIALLPLLPALHTQLEFMLKPAVKYFVAFPAVDAMVGLFIGLWLGKCIRGKRIEAPFSLPPWPLALMLLVVSFSCAVTIARNLWQTASVFSIYDVALSFLNFKLLPRESDYFPISEWVTFSTLTLTVLVLSDYLQKEKANFEIIFKPLIVGLGLSALWGIFQSLTGFGLGGYSLDRPYFFGFAAFGFQPDIHAYGGLMSLGAVGLMGFITQTTSTRWYYWTIVVSLVSWIALIQSKSRASIVIVIIFCLVYSLIKNRNNINIFSDKNRLFYFFISVVIFLSVIIFGLLLYYVTNNSWIKIFDVVNLASSWRLDLFLGALRMWWQFPLLGIGQGGFLRVASDYDFSGSALMAMLGGENAHNYFLQTLAEIGLVGCIAVACMLVWPTIKQVRPAANVSVWIAIISLCLGNLYSHSFVVRENLFIFGALLALLYGSVTMANNRKNLTPYTRRSTKYFFLGVTVASIFLILGMAIFEVTNSFNKLPFQYSSKCYLQVASEEFKRGHVFIDVPPNIASARVSLQGGASVNWKTLDRRIDAKLFDRLSTRWYPGEVKTSELREDLAIVDFELPLGQLIGEKGGVIALSIGECLNPDDLKNVSAKRNHRVHILNIEY